MKIYVKASESKSEPSSETIIRMTLSNSARDRGFTRSNDMLKLHFFGIDKETSLIIAAALQSIAWDEDISDYDSNISQEDIDSLMSIAAKLGVTSGQSAISYLDNNDTGSGEPIIFSIRYNNKLIYSSGLHESEWGKMPAGFSNDSAEVRNDANYQRYINNITKSISNLSPNVVQYGLSFYLDIPCEGPDNPQLYLGSALSKDEWIKESNSRYPDSSTKASYVISQARKRVKAVDGMKLKKVPTDQVSNVPAYRFNTHSDGADSVSSDYNILPDKATLKRAKSAGVPYVYVETKYL